MNLIADFVVQSFLSFCRLLTGYLLLVNYSALNTALKIRNFKPVCQLAHALGKTMDLFISPVFPPTSVHTR